MILLETNELYQNSIDYFRENIMNSLPDDHRVWCKVYHDWLRSQGAVIVKANRDTFGTLLTNAIGISPGYDHFGFENEKDVAWFMLKWS